MKCCCPFHLSTSLFQSNHLSLAWHLNLKIIYSCYFLQISWLWNNVSTYPFVQIRRHHIVVFIFEIYLASIIYHITVQFVNLKKNKIFYLIILMNFIFYFGLDLDHRPINFSKLMPDSDTACRFPMGSNPILEANLKRVYVRIWGYESGSESTMVPFQIQLICIPLIRVH